MTDDDRPEFASAMLRLATVYGEPVDERRAEAYFDALADIPIESVLDAVRSVIRTSRFFPRPSELRAYLPSAIPDVGEAQEELRRALWAWRPGRIPAASPFIMQLVQRMGGWEAVTMLDAERQWQRASKILPAMQQAAMVRGDDPRLLPDGTSTGLLTDDTGQRKEIRAILTKITGGKP